MKKFLYGVMVCFALSACGAVPEPLMGQASPRAVQAISVTTVTPPGTPTPNQLQTAMAVIAIDGATSTAASAATGTSYVVTSTYQAQETQAFWVGVTLGIATERGLETQVAKTETAGTHQANGLTQQSPSQTALAATQTAEKNDLQTTVTQMWIWKVGGTVAVVGILWLLILGGFDYRRYKIEQGSAKNLQEKTSALQPTANGFPLVPSASLKPGEKLVNMNLAHRAVLDPAEADDLTSEQALANANAQRKLDGIRSVANSPAVGHLLKRIIKEEQEAAKKPMPDVTITKPDQPLLTQMGIGEIVEADWRFVENWDGKGDLIPCGVNKNGLAFVNIDENDHYGLFGLTGEGKSRGWLRPFLAGLLASAHRAIILGKTGDFWMFDNHPNVNLIPVRDVTEKSEARRYADYLYRMVREMNQRDAWLTSRHQSTWKRAGRENTFIVLDEIGNALEQMAKAERDDCMRWIASLVKQGRKNGFNVITASQRAVGFKNIVEQMSRVVYRLSDEASSRIALGRPGAEELPQKKGNFFAKFDTIDLYGSFMPTDEQLIYFLHSRPVKQHEPLDWIDGTARDVEETGPERLIEDAARSVPAAETSSQVSSPIDQYRAEAEKSIETSDKIVQLYLDFLNRRQKPVLAEIERAVFGKTGGSFHNNTKQAIAAFEGVGVEELNQVIEEHVASWNTTTDSATTEKTAPSPDFQAV